MTRVLVLGARGQLGSALRETFGEAFEVLAPERAEVDLLIPGAARAAIRRLRPDLVLNAAADNRVDRAEDDPLPVLRVNALAVGELAEASASVGARLVHFGSDFVFDGRGERPYVEDDEPAPISVYGASKLLGERLAAAAPGALVLRVESLFGGRPAHSTIDRLVGALARGEEARVFSDRTLTPSYVPDVAAAVRALVERESPGGLYHVVSSGVTTWEALAREAARLLGLASPRLVPVSVHDVPMRAPRPRACALSNAKLRAAGVGMPSWTDALARAVAERVTARE